MYHLIYADLILQSSVHSKGAYSKVDHTHVSIYMLIHPDAKSVQVYNVSSSFCIRDDYTSHMLYMDIYIYSMTLDDCDPVASTHPYTCFSDCCSNGSSLRCSIFSRPFSSELDRERVFALQKQERKAYTHTHTHTQMIERHMKVVHRRGRKKTENK